MKKPRVDEKKKKLNLSFNKSSLAACVIATQQSKNIPLQHKAGPSMSSFCSCLGCWRAGWTWGYTISCECTYTPMHTDRKQTLICIRLSVLWCACIRTHTTVTGNLEIITGSSNLICMSSPIKATWWDY